MEGVRRAWSWLVDEPRHRIGARALQIAVGLLFWFRTATEVRFARFLWGPHGLGRGDANAVAGSLAGLLSLPFRTDIGTNLALASSAIAAGCLICGIATRWATAWLLLAAMAFESRFPELLDGGDNITRIVLLYMLFLLPWRAHYKRGSGGVFVHNAAVLAIVAQLCVMYLTAGFMKATGARWSQGTALYLISQVDWFSQPSTRFLFKNPFVATVGCYATVFFQLWFPIAIQSRWRVLWVFVGIGMHLSIAYTMGLIPFSIVMIGLELIVVSDGTYARIASMLDQSWTEVSRRALERVRGVRTAVRAP